MIYRQEAENTGHSITIEFMKILAGRSGIDLNRLPDQVIEEVTEQLSEFAIEEINEAMEEREATVEASQLNGLDHDVDLLKHKLTRFTVNKKTVDVRLDDSIDVIYFLGDPYLQYKRNGHTDEMCYRLADIGYFVFGDRAVG